MSLRFPGLPYATPRWLQQTLPYVSDVQNQAFFPISHVGRDAFLQKKKSASLPVGQNKKVFHQRNKFPSRFAHWCFQKLFSFTSIVPSQLLVFLCQRHWACLGLTLRVGSRCWLCDRSVSATGFDKNRLFPAAFWRVCLFFSVFLLSCFEPFISLGARILKRCAQLFSWWCFIFCTFWGLF